MSRKIDLHQKTLSRFRSMVTVKLGLSTSTTPPTHSPYDCLVGGRVRCEIKVSEGRACEGHMQWLFNLHRHNKIAENGTDFYCLHVLNIFGIKYGAWLIIPYSEIPRKKTFPVSCRSMMFKWSKWFNRWELIREQANQT